MGVELLLVCVAILQADSRSERDTAIEDARKVVAAVVVAARDNARRTDPLRGDALTAAYIRAAALEARRLPDQRAAKAFALGAGVALDPSNLVRSNPLVSRTWQRIETAEERTARLAVLGRPTLHGRQDLAQHFSVSLALAALLGDHRSEQIGLLKEIFDAGDGGSGFSFADLAANLGGITLGRRLRDDPARLATLTRGFLAADFLLPPKGLDEGLTLKEFEKKYGGIRDARFREKRDDLERRTAALKGLRE
ncbi:MAG: hypothetical protein U0840_23660 [Gemmataceae bacterium]